MTNLLILICIRSLLFSSHAPFLFLTDSGPLFNSPLLPPPLLFRSVCLIHCRFPFHSLLLSPRFDSQLVSLPSSVLLILPPLLSCLLSIGALDFTSILFASHCCHTFCVYFCIFSLHAFYTFVCCLAVVFFPGKYFIAENCISLYISHIW